jgi:hypothetical protein
MIGTLVGHARIPNYMTHTLWNFDCTKEGIQRPDFLSVKKKALDNIYKII